MSRSCTAINSYSPATPPLPVTSDRMAETEFEAAEVLASLSKSTPPPSSREASTGCGGGAGESVDSWGRRSKRSSTVRVKSESSPVDSALNSASAPLEEEKKPVLLAFDLNEDGAATFNQEEECLRGSKYVVKAEEAELAEPSHACTASQTVGKSRQNLSEVEKEAQRLRRVLANRESARQTIRRRQALYEELTRKVADLARENENLKKEKESAVEDYQALKCTNKKLNEQVAEQFGSKLEENVGKSTSANCSIPALPFANYPYMICKDTPFVCPYNIQLPDMNPPQLGQAKLSESPNVKGNLPLSGHWCMVPYPLFIPMPDAKNGPNLIPFFPAADEENETGVDYQHAGTSSPKAVSCPKSLPSEYPVNAKTQFPSSVEPHHGTASHEIPFGLSLDVADQKLRSQSKRVGDSSSKQSRMSQSYDVSVEAISSKGIRDVNVLQDSRQEPTINHGKRLVDPAAARKRRKELKKMKSMHCRSHRKEGLRLVGESHPSLSRNA